MISGEYSEFIVPAYLISGGMVICLAGWITLKHAQLKNELTTLEEKGARRRSHGESST